jgi:hypothetical protein
MAAALMTAAVIARNGIQGDFMLPHQLARNCQLPRLRASGVTTGGREGARPRLGMVKFGGLQTCQ